VKNGSLQISDFWLQLWKFGVGKTVLVNPAHCKKKMAIVTQADCKKKNDYGTQAHCEKKL
jgi:hypothetical protein